MNEKPFTQEEEHSYWIERHRQYGLSWQSVGFSGDERVNGAFYECRRRAWYQMLQYYAVNLRGMRVLDVGCGVGIFSRLYHEAGAEVYGIDISPEAIAHCNSLQIGTFVQGTIANLTDKVQGQFDIIHCFDVLYHLTDETEWELALRGFAALSTKETRWFLTEFRTRKTHIGNVHIVKRSPEHYAVLLANYERKIDKEIPIYWLYSALPRLSWRFPELITATNGLGLLLRRFLREYVVMWSVTDSRMHPLP